ncbi:hypothetical protein KAURM247S_06194 [Kitasatospora aureofaciens]
MDLRNITRTAPEEDKKRIGRDTHLTRGRLIGNQSGTLGNLTVAHTLNTHTRTD